VTRPAPLIALDSFIKRIKLLSPAASLAIYGVQIELTPSKISKQRRDHS